MIVFSQVSDEVENISGNFHFVEDGDFQANFPRSLEVLDSLVGQPLKQVEKLADIFRASGAWALADPWNDGSV